MLPTISNHPLRLSPQYWQFSWHYRDKCTNTELEKQIQIFTLLHNWLICCPTFNSSLVLLWKAALGTSSYHFAEFSEVSTWSFYKGKGQTSAIQAPPSLLLSAKVRWKMGKKDQIKASKVNTQSNAKIYQQWHLQWQKEINHPLEPVNYYWSCTFLDLWWFFSRALGKVKILKKVFKILNLREVYEFNGKAQFKCHFPSATALIWN